MTNGFDDIEKKIKDISKNTSADTDKRILEDAFAVLEQVPRIKSQSSEKPVWAAVAAIIIAAVVIGSFFIFNRSKPKAQIVKTLQVHEALKIAEPNAKQTDETKKLQTEIEHIVAMARAGDVKGLRLVLDEGSETAKMLAAEYLEKMLPSHIDKPPQNIEDEIIPQDTNVSSVLSGDILEAADQNEILIEAAVEDKPRIISVNPPSGSEMPLVSELEIVFDRPMNPQYLMIVNPADKQGRQREFGVFENYVDYDTSQNKFIIPLRLPANWNGQVLLQNFISEDGIEAEPLVVNYQTLRKPFSDKLLNRFERNANSYELIALMEKIKNARKQLNSLSMTIQETMTLTFGHEFDERSAQAVYKFQGDRQFYADISNHMDIPYFIASDGTHCWVYAGRENNEELTVAAFEDINELTVDICNPFGIKDKEVREVIRQYNLQYEHADLIENRTCYLVRSWYAEAGSRSTNCNITIWWFDAETYLPVQVFADYAGQNTVFAKFIYHSINEPLADDVFAYNSIADIEPGFPEELNEDYDRRYITIIDGTSTGRVNVGWGRKGPKGTTGSGLSSGLN